MRGLPHRQAGSRSNASHRKGNRESRAGLRVPPRLEAIHLRHDYVRSTTPPGQGIPGVRRIPYGSRNRLHLNRAGTQPNHREAGIAVPGAHLMMLARAASSILLLAGAYSRLTAQDAREIIGRGVALYERNAQLSRNYTFLERQEVRELDRSGHLKGRKIETWDITLLDGSPYRRLVARNDQPLTAEEQRAEEEKLRVSNEERRKETADERAQRLARWQRRIDRQ